MDAFRGLTPLWAQLRTFKHIKISQALHCPDYCLNIICFYIPSLPLWLIFPLEKSISDDFFFLYRGFGVGWVSIPAFHAIDIEVASFSYIFCFRFTISHLLQRTQTHTKVTWRPPSAPRTVILTHQQPWQGIVHLEKCVDEYWWVQMFLIKKGLHDCNVILSHLSRKTHFAHLHHQYPIQWAWLNWPQVRTVVLSQPEYTNTWYPDLGLESFPYIIQLLRPKIPGLYLWNSL